MPSYRFCRPDDLALLVQALNACYVVHYPGMPTLTPERFKELITLYDVRPGNCMVAQENREPVGVLISSKRNYGAWIQALGCRAEVQRRGIARQMLEAVVSKIAIQRVPDLTVEVPAERTPACKFFTAMEFTVRGRYVDYQGPLPTTARVSGEVVAMAASALLVYHGQFHPVPPCWERHAQSLAGYGALPRGYAYCEQGEVRGYLLHLGAAVLDLAVAPAADPGAVVPALLARMQAEGVPAAAIAKVPETAPLAVALTKLGFTPVRSFLLMGRRLEERDG